FGVRDPQDPAIAVAERVMRDLPGRDLALVVDDRVIGTNLKVSNLANMYGAAKHDLLVIADSDMRVDQSYLGSVVGPLRDPAVGVVTCLYAGRATGGLWAVLGAMFINDWFLPSVLVARSAQPLGHAMSLVTHSLLLSGAYLLVSSLSILGAVVAGGALVLRLGVHYTVRASLGLREPGRAWLVPLRDVLCFVVWVASFWGRTV